MPTHVDNNLTSSSGSKMMCLDHKSKISQQKKLLPFPALIYKKTCVSTGKMKYFIETFRALGVGRGHSSYRLTKSVSFYSSVRKSSCQVHWRLETMFI